MHLGTGHSNSVARIGPGASDGATYCAAESGTIGSARDENDRMKSQSPAAQLDGFVRKHSSPIAAETKRALARMRRLVPGALELIYDNYNALAIGFGPTERASDAVVSIVVFPRWISLFFLQAATELPDPHRLLKGNGKVVRHIVLGSAADLDRPEIRSLIKIALARADPAIDHRGRRRIVIKSISAKQRPRRPRNDSQQ